MANYRLTPEAYKVSRRQLLNRALLMGVVLIGGGFCYYYFILKGSLSTALSLALVYVALSSWSYYRTSMLQKAVLDSYRLEIEPTQITRLQQGLPALQLLLNEVTSITQNHQGVLTIATADKYRAIYVPAQVTSRDELLAELSPFTALTIRTQKTLLERLTTPILLAIVVLMGTFYATDNKIVSTGTGVLLLGFLSWSCWHVWRNPIQTLQTRRLRWTLPLVFLSILAGVIARLIRY